MKKTKKLSASERVMEKCLNRGRSYYSKGHFTKALMCYNKVIKLDPTYHYAYVDRGILYAEWGEFKKAPAYYVEKMEAVS